MLRDVRGVKARNKRGFSLSEMLLALTIGAMGVLVAHELFAAVADRGRTLTAARTELDRTANARRWLHAAFLSLDGGTEGASGFEGRPDHAAFSTWLLTADGWFEREQLTLGVEQGRLRALVASRTPVVLADSVIGVQFDYLLEPGEESRWVREWVSPVSAPVAVRLRLARTGCGMRDAGCVVDTLLFVIKERG